MDLECANVKVGHRMVEGVGGWRVGNNGDRKGNVIC